jgi:hypothetical protein
MKNKKNKSIKEINGKNEEVLPSIYELLSEKESKNKIMTCEAFEKKVKEADVTELKNLCKEFNVSTMGSIPYIKEDLVNAQAKSKRLFENCNIKQPKQTEMTPELEALLKKL